MNVFLALLVLLLIIFLLLAIYPLKVSINVHSDKLPDFHFEGSWLKPILKGIVTEEHKEMVLKIYLLNNKVYKKSLMQNDDAKNPKSFSDKIDFVKSLDPKFEKLEASYGFEDPSVTGMVFGAINLFSPYIQSFKFFNNPDFNMLQDYFYVDAKFNISIPKLLVALIRYNRKPEMEAIYHKR